VEETVARGENHREKITYTFSYVLCVRYDVRVQTMFDSSFLPFVLQRSMFYFPFVFNLRTLVSNLISISHDVRIV